MSYFGDVYTGDHLSTISKVHINKQILFTHKLIVSYSVQASKKISVFRISRIPSFYLKAKCKAMVSIDMKDKRLHIFENFCCLNRTSGCHRIIFAFTKRVLSFRAEMSFVWWIWILYSNFSGDRVLPQKTNISYRAYFAFWGKCKMQGFSFNIQITLII